MKQMSPLLETNGLRVTSSRLTLLDVLAKSTQPMDVTEIQKKFTHNKSTTDVVTIYRMLEIFLKKGIVKRLDFHEGKFRYELVQTDHHHLICQKCGTVADIKSCPVNELEADILQKQNFLVKQHALEFFGLCANCR